MEFISETEGGEYSINPHYPYGKWYFYEKILKIPVYVIFHPKMATLDVFRLNSEQYELQKPDQNNRYWLPEINLFLGIWEGKKAEFDGYWLRWWDEKGNLLLWGAESIEQERQLLEDERQRTKDEHQRAEDERQRAEDECQRAEQNALLLEQEKLANQKLLNKLKQMGIESEEVDL